jgi:hypothetical protein
VLLKTGQVNTEGFVTSVIEHVEYIASMEIRGQTDKYTIRQHFTQNVDNVFNLVSN